MKVETSPLRMVLDRNQLVPNMKNTPSKAIKITDPVAASPLNADGTSAPIKMVAISI